ncbi:MAG: PQQ-binding-like beta-propeller repeat protein [Pirellulales bacterium]|nr:PQQ-binding-like beta-propeller repeat protein [Pirellulales bacterium]
MKSQTVLTLSTGLVLLFALAGCEDSTAKEPGSGVAQNSKSQEVDSPSGKTGPANETNVEETTANESESDTVASDEQGNADGKSADVAEDDHPAEDIVTEEKLNDSDTAESVAAQGAGPLDWPQWGGSTSKNNTPNATNVPSKWDAGDFDPQTGDWIPGSGQNIKWVAKLGSQSYGNPVVANGQVYVGTNNGAGYLKRYPYDVDLGVLACFRESDGEFLWQHSSEKLVNATEQDWPLQGICCAPCVEGDRLWIVTSRGVVVCLDTQGFRDGENDGPFASEESTAEDEADTIWEYDMLKEINLFQHNMCSCSVTVWKDYLFVNTSNGVDESHDEIPSPEAPSFIALNKNTGELLWADNSPGVNILHGQWSSPTFAEIDGQPQVIFPGGDGYVRSFDPAGDGNGNAKLLWKFDTNPKDSKWIRGGRGTRNNIIGTAVVYDNKIYLAAGQDPEHGEGIGHLWCIDPTKRGDISPTLVFDASDNPVPHRRLQAAILEEGDVIRDNENSGAIWGYIGTDINSDGEIEWEEEMHRSITTPVIKDDLLYIADFSGLFHCVDAQSGKAVWTYDMFSAAWGSALVVDGKVYIGDEDGDVTVFKHGREMEKISEINMGNAVYSTPIIANGVLYLANKTHLFAIVNQDGEPEPDGQ